MSQGDVRHAADFVSAFSRGGTEAASEYIDSAVSPQAWNSITVQDAVAAWEEELDEFRYDTHIIIDAGESGAVVLGTVRGQIKDSDSELKEPLAAALKFIGGEISRWRGYLSWNEALVAVGLKSRRKTPRGIWLSFAEAFERRFEVGPVEALCINTFIALLVGAFGYGAFVTIRDVINSTAAIVAGGVSFAAVYGVIAAWSGLLEPFGLREAIGDGLMVVLEGVVAPFERLGRVFRRPSDD